MVAVRYHWSWRAIQATVQMTDEIDSLSYHSDLHSPTAVVHTTDATTRTISGAWWHPTPDAGGFVILVNTSVTQTSLSLQVLPGNGATATTLSYSVEPHQTLKLSISSLLASQIVQKGDAGAITITYSGPQDSLIAYGGIEDATVGYSATIPFWEFRPERVEPHDKPISIHAAGLMVGKPSPTMQFPVDTTFAPYAILHNTSSEPRTIQLSVSDGSSGSQPQNIATVTLQPNQAEFLDIQAQLDTAGFHSTTDFLNTELSFTGQMQDLQVTQGSVDQSGSYVFDVAAQAAGKSAARLLCYWTTQGDSDTMMSLWNYTSKPQDINLTLYFQGGQYLIPLHLEANESANLDILSIIKSRAPDPNGNVIPSNITEGSAMVTSGTEDRTLFPIAISNAEFNVRNATCSPLCATCNGFVQFFIVGTTPNFYLGTSRQLQGIVVYNTGTEYSTTYGTWSSQSPSIVSMNSTGMATANFVGTSNVSFLLDGVPVDAGSICSYTGNANCPIEDIEAIQPAQVNPPQIQGIAPTPLIYGATNQPITIIGTGFSAAGYTTSVTSGNITFTQVTVNGSGSITALYTVGCGASVVNGDAIQVTLSGPDGSTNSSPFSVPIALPPAPAPTITLQGSENQLTGTQTAIVGQQIALSGNQSLPNSCVYATPQWGTPTGNPINGYTASTASGSVQTFTPSTNTTETFYWPYPSTSGTPWTETYQYTLSGGGATSASPQTSVSFNVAGPTGVSISSQVGTINISANQILQLGGSLSNTGIMLTATSTPPANYSGAYSWVQLITNNTTVATNAAGAPFTCVYGPGLDSTYPYERGNDMDDNPSIPLLDSYVDETASEAFVTYLMWTPYVTGSTIPVPLGSVSWSWSGDAVKNQSTGQWSISTSSVGTPVFTPGANFPTWSVLVDPPQGATCHH